MRLVILVLVGLGIVLLPAVIAIRVRSTGRSRDKAHEQPQAMPTAHSGDEPPDLAEYPPRRPDGSYIPGSRPDRESKGQP